MTEPVLLDKIGNYRLRKLFSHIPYIKRDTKFVSDTTCITGVVKGAAAPLPTITVGFCARQREVHPYDLMTGIHHAGGRDRRVDSTRHRD